MKRENQTGVQDQRSGLPAIKREIGGRQESHEDEFGSECSTLAVIMTTLTLLICAGEDFDEVDFAVPQGDEPDGVTLEQGTELESLRTMN